jgi:hypothetical protein
VLRVVFWSRNYGDALGVWDLALTAVTSEQLKRGIRKLALDHKRILRSLKFVTEGVTDLSCAKMCC